MQSEKSDSLSVSRCPWFLPPSARFLHSRRCQRVVYKNESASMSCADRGSGLCLRGPGSVGASKLEAAISDKFRTKEAIVD